MASRGSLDPSETDYLGGQYRGVDMQLVLVHEWLKRNKLSRGELNAVEARLKQACWEWFSSLPPAALEKVRACAWGYSAVYHILVHGDGVRKRRVLLSRSRC